MQPPIPPIETPPLPSPEGANCPNCGQSVPFGQTMCPNCGRNIAPTSSSTSVLKIIGAICLGLISFVAGGLGACFLLIGGISGGEGAGFFGFAIGAVVVAALCIWGMVLLIKKK